MLFALLCASTVHAGIMNTSMFNVSEALNAYSNPLRVTFWDFDETLTVGTVGDPFIALCDPNCAAYFPNVSCTCNVTTNYFGDWLVNNSTESARILASPDIVFNGTDRRDRLAQTLALLQSKGIQTVVVSTAWYYMNSSSWGYFLSKVFNIAGLDTYFPLANILTLNDPGYCISANKSAVIANYLAKNNWLPENGLFMDDSPSNIRKAQGFTGWLQVIPRTGLAVDALDYIEARASQTWPVFCNCPNGVPTVWNGTGATLCATDNTVDCQSCNAGYSPSAAFGTGPQSCVAGGATNTSAPTPTYSGSVSVSRWLVLFLAF